ncbi:MAG: hypothetical protein EBT05_18795 [Betaproteobacteria bacterium]|nr:hypothetical protein [Betaproteobacteria bacterium]
MDEQCFGLFLKASRRPPRWVAGFAGAGPIGGGPPGGQPAPGLSPYAIRILTALMQLSPAIEA